MKTSTPFLVTVILLVLVPACTPTSEQNQVATGVAGTLTALPLPTLAANHPTAPTAAFTPELGANAPHPKASLCPDTGEAHDNNLFHTANLRAS